MGTCRPHPNKTYTYKSSNMKINKTVRQNKHKVICTNKNHPCPRNIMLYTMVSGATSMVSKPCLPGTPGSREPFPTQSYLHIYNIYIYTWCQHHIFLANRSR